MRDTRLMFVLVSAALCTSAVGTARADYFEGPARVAAEAEAARLQAIKLRWKARLFALPGVYGVGIGFDRANGELLFKVMYEASDLSPAIPARIEGVRVRAVPGRRPRAGNTGGTYANPAHAGQHSLPVKMGNSVRHANGCPDGCTLGFKACDTNTGEAVFVTADHCADDFNGCLTGALDPMYHTAPGDGAADCLWHEEVGVVSGHAAPTCGANSLVDAAKVVSDDGLSDWEVRDIGLPATTFVLPFVGGLWSKSGRTTGYTAGEISAIHVDLVVDYGCCANDPEMQDLFELDTISGDACLGGDSGSAVLDYYLPPHILGMVIAGDGTPCYALPIATVLGALSLSLDRGLCIDLCPAEEAAGDGPHHAILIAATRDLRSVLAASELGKGFVRAYYAFAKDWARLYATRPLLLAQTTVAFQTSLPVIEALAARRPITVTPAQITAVDALLAAHGDAADAGPLRSQFAAWRQALHDPRVRRAFQVTVSGPAGDFDRDGVPDDTDNCPTLASTSQRDSDADGVGDACDNCVKLANPRVAPDFVYQHRDARTTGDQLDDDGDGFGNRCDGAVPGRAPGPKCATCPLDCNGGEHVSCAYPP